GIATDDVPRAEHGMREVRMHHVHRHAQPAEAPGDPERAVVCFEGEDRRAGDDGDHGPGGAGYSPVAVCPGSAPPAGAIGSMTISPCRTAKAARRSLGWARMKSRSRSWSLRRK